MNFNGLIIPTFLLATIFFKTGLYLSQLCHRQQHVVIKIILVLSTTVIAVPGVLFTVYYLHFFDQAKWFYQFRALPFTELSAAGLGLLVGILFDSAQRQHWLSQAFSPVVLLALLLWLLIPYVKPIFYSVDFADFEDRWSNGICLQTTPSSCGPASAATLLKAAGYSVSERQLAQECFTSKSGTENWYIARALRRRGFKVNYLITAVKSGYLPYPALAGVQLNNGWGHFIVVLDETECCFIIGDPLVGKRILEKHKLAQYYNFTGFFMQVKFPSRH